MNISYKLDKLVGTLGVTAPTAAAREFTPAGQPEPSRLLSSTLDGGMPAPSWTPPRETVHLTLAQQRTLMNALRRSVKIVA